MQQARKELDYTANTDAVSTLFQLRKTLLKTIQ